MKHKKWILVVIATLPVWTETAGRARGAHLCLVPLIAIQEPIPAVKIELITVEELNSKFAKNEPVTIIDVRSGQSFAGSDSTIKGSIHFKLRRLKSRLRFPPLKDLPRDREVVTYCACPNDRASIRAAQILIDAGFKRVRALKGGWNAWVKAGGQVQTNRQLRK